MKPLKTVHWLLTWQCMAQPDESASGMKRAANIGAASAIFVAVFYHMATGFFVCIQFLSVDMKVALFAFMAFFGSAALIYVLINAFSNRFKIQEIFDKLSTIYSKNDDIVSTKLLTKANDHSEGLWAIFKWYLIIPCANTVIFSLASIIVCYFTRGYLDAERFYHPTKFILPWNQTTLWGYFGETAVVIAVVLGYFIPTNSLLMLFISICLYHRSSYQIFKHLVEQLWLPSDGDRCESKLINNLICFHISVKDWFLASIDVYSPFALVQLIGSSIILATCLFYLDLVFHDMDLSVVFTSMGAIVSISNLFFYCYFGKLATDSFEKMSECLYSDSDWLNLPIYLQKYFVVMIATMQKPIYYHGFQFAKLNLHTFIQLIKKVFACYLMFKKISA